MNENLASMMLCTLCSDKPANGLDWKYPDEDVHRNDMHFTSGKLWQPLKGHRLFEQHLRSLELFKKVK